MGWNDNLPELNLMATEIALKAGAVKESGYEGEYINKNDPAAAERARAIAKEGWAKGEYDVPLHDLLRAIDYVIVQSADL